MVLPHLLLLQVLLFFLRVIALVQFSLDQFVLELGQLADELLDFDNPPLPGGAPPFRLLKLFHFETDFIVLLLLLPLVVEVLHDSVDVRIHQALNLLPLNVLD